jgi:dihydroorotate dehydrogenase
MSWPLLRSVMFRLDAENAHRLAHAAFGLVTPEIARRQRHRPAPLLAVETMGLRFDSPVGLAAGFDKGDAHLAALFALGFSHVEIGTITPRPQAGNDRPRLFRIPEAKALVNRMGFNNAGAEVCAQRLAAAPKSARFGPVGVNIGKNKATPNDRAVDDYLACIDALHAQADYMVINISSPNTPGLRELQEKSALEKLIRACSARLAERAPGKPLLLKLSPDLEPEPFDEAVDVAIDAGVHGVIATNTTLSRPGLETNLVAREPGGLSGAPLEPLATACVARAFSRARGRVPIIGAGGVMDAAGAWAKIRAGATLVQAYTGLIYGGPTFVRRINEGLVELMARDGFKSVSDAVGADHRR